MFNLPETRPMTRKERRAFKAAGIDPAFQNGEMSVSELNDKIVDFVCDKVYKFGDKADDVPYDDLIKFADNTYRMTYGLMLDIKNSVASGTGTVTDAQPIAEIAEPQS